MSRLDDLRAMRAFVDREIAAILADEINGVRRRPAVVRVSELYSVPIDDVMLGVRRHEVTRARHAMTWLLHQQGMSTNALARVFGYAGPPSVWQALQRVENDAGMRALLLGLEGAA